MKMNNMDAEKLEQHLNEFKKNPLEKGLLLSLPEQGRELILLAAELKSIPVQNAPKAALRRKYEAEKVLTPNLAFAWLFNFRALASLASLAVIVLGGGFAYVTAQSLPGQKLFSVKKSAEQFRVKFASNDIQKAYLQVQIAKKRVAEAQKVASSQNKNPESQLAAIKEVSQATELAAKQVETLSAKAIKESDQPLLSSLEDISREEKDLISSWTLTEQNAGDKEDVIALSLKNQIKVSAIKQAIEIAVAEEAVANLSADPSEILVSGQITQIGKNSITVEKTIFILEEKTSVVSQEGSALKLEDLKLESKVAASGKKAEGKLFAVKITLLEALSKTPDDKETGEVKGETAKPIELNSTTPQSILKPVTEETEPANKPNTASGSFIMEDPSPQFAP